MTQQPRTPTTEPRWQLMTLASDALTDEQIRHQLFDYINPAPGEQQVLTTIDDLRAIVRAIGAYGRDQRADLLAQIEKAVLAIRSPDRFVAMDGTWEQGLSEAAVLTAIRSAAPVEPT